MWINCSSANGYFDYVTSQSNGFKIWSNLNDGWDDSIGSVQIFLQPLGHLPPLATKGSAPREHCPSAVVRSGHRRPEFSWVTWSAVSS